MDTPKRRLEPMWALKHPLWWGALALMAMNDHVLKGAGLLPGGLTGKLSDVAGLVVAPVLLAALLRLRTKRGLFGAWVVTGGVFAAIQLHPAAVDALNAILGLVGHSWRVWMDPSDCLALLVMPLAWALFVPRMEVDDETSERARERSQRLVPLAAIVLGTPFCLATSPPEGGGDPRCCSAPAIQADLYVHNSTGEAIEVSIRELAPDVELDCDEVASDPRRYLDSDAIFQPAGVWTVPENVTVPLRQDTSSTRRCSAARLTVRGVSRLFFWTSANVPVASKPGWVDRELDDLPLGAIAIESDDDQLVLDTGELEVMYTLALPGEALAGARCEIPGDEVRLGWSEPLPRAARTLGAVAPGLDGCLGIDLLSTIDGQVYTDLWYLCLPDGAWPFEEGEVIEVSELPSDAAGRAAGLELTSDRATLGLLRGQVLPVQVGGVPIGIETEVEAGCAPLRDLECGSLSRPAALAVSVGEVPARTIANGQRDTFVSGDRSVDVFNVRTTERPLLRPACDDGYPETGRDVEAVYVVR